MQIESRVRIYNYEIKPDWMLMWFQENWQACQKELLLDRHIQFDMRLKDTKPVWIARCIEKDVGNFAFGAEALYRVTLEI